MKEWRVVATRRGGSTLEVNASAKVRGAKPGAISMLASSFQAALDWLKLTSTEPRPKPVPTITILEHQTVSFRVPIELCFCSQIVLPSTSLCTRPWSLLFVLPQNDRQSPINSMHRGDRKAREHSFLSYHLASVPLIIEQNNPLHISLFPAEERAPLEFQFLLSSCLDIFEARLPHKTVDQDFGLLQAVDERLAMYGWLTNTGVKFVVVVDMEGRQATAADSKMSTSVGLRDADLKPVSLHLRIALMKSGGRLKDHI